MNDFIIRIMAWANSRDRGASAVEYVLILAAVIGLVGLMVFAMGGRTRDMLNGACNQLGMGATCR